MALSLDQGVPVINMNTFHSGMIAILGAALIWGAVLTLHFLPRFSIKAKSMMPEIWATSLVGALAGSLYLVVLFGYTTELPRFATQVPSFTLLVLILMAGLFVTIHNRKDPNTFLLMRWLEKKKQSRSPDDKTNNQ